MITLSEKKATPNQNKELVIVKSFRHWRTGKLIKAEDYGKKAFVFYRNK